MTTLAGRNLSFASNNPTGDCYRNSYIKQKDLRMTITVGLIHPLSPDVRRGSDRKEAASYVGVSPTHFDKLARIGKMPKPVQLLGRKIWDRRVLENLL